MKYCFRCEKCNDIQNIEISMNDYDKLKDKQICSKCGAALKRVIEWNGIATGSGDGWFGKSDGGKAI